MELSEGYVVGLLADLESSVPDLEERLAVANRRAATVDGELGTLLGRLDESRRTLRDARLQTGRSGIAINEQNLQIATLHQEVAAIKQRSSDIKLEMDRVGPGAIYRRLRRERAKLSVQIEDREEEIEVVRRDVEAERQVLAQAEASLIEERDRSRLVTLELDKLQGQLPSPYLYTQLSESVAARAHCRFHLDGAPGPWRSEVAESIALARRLHEELRLGKYRLDRNSDLVGGRATATAESLFAAVALDDLEGGRELFELATDPGLYFHQIFNVFRVWCLGLYLTADHQRLHELLRLHRYAEGLRGAYVQAFIGLVTGDERGVRIGVKDICRHEWELWQDPQTVRGLGVINVGAAALVALARRSGLDIDSPGPTVPASLLPPRPRPKAPSRRTPARRRPS